VNHVPLTEDIDVFVTVADLGTLTGASKALGLPKSTLSRRLARLEAQLGLRLFIRHRQRLRLTESGTALLRQAREALAALRALADAATMAHKVPEGRLRVSVPQDLIGFSDVWLDFIERFPRVALELEPTNRYVDVVSEGFDLALRAGKGQDEALVARRVGAYSLIAVASPSYVAAYGTLREPADLRRHSCVLLSPMGRRPGHPDRPELPHRHIVCKDVHFAMTACLQGYGIAILPQGMARPAIEQGRLAPVLGAYNPLVVPLFAVYPEHAHLRASVAAFIDVVARHFGGSRGAGT
jgi:DNA-binding transcriptional LysR family regulator